MTALSEVAFALCQEYLLDYPTVIVSGLSVEYICCFVPFNSFKRHLACVISLA